ncbi:hypothetical protein F4604DRAFT_1913735 [Suillus subluteus]|nr:hypothetical protein F4604DRAFT_1913735 [Suillus subluteus]
MSRMKSLIKNSALKKFSFGYTVIDETRRIKNVDSILAQINNLKELLALLNFICHEIFFLRHVKSDVEKNLLPEKEINIYIDLTEMQRKWYCSVLEKDIVLLTVRFSSTLSPTLRLDWKKGEQDPPHEHEHAVA